MRHNERTAGGTMRLAAVLFIEATLRPIRVLVVPSPLRGICFISSSFRISRSISTYRYASNPVIGAAASLPGKMSAVSTRSSTYR
jgi:hypothetical protein